MLRLFILSIVFHRAGAMMLYGGVGLKLKLKPCSFI